MRIIKSIEIKHFRSFLGTPERYKTSISDLKNLNIFSGANDSGKSNIFRALNLFFNNELSYGIPFEFDRDFFLGKKDGGHKVVEIKVSFDLSGDKEKNRFLPNEFTISKFYDRYGFRNYLYSFQLKEKEKLIKIDSRSEENKEVYKIFLGSDPTEKDVESAKKREWGYRVRFAGFLNKSISFEYIPAIRDKNFFSQLFGRVITLIKNNENKKMEDLQREKVETENWEKTIGKKGITRERKTNLKDQAWRNRRIKEIEETQKRENQMADAIKNLEQKINQYSNGLIRSIEFLDSEFRIGQNLQDFFEGFDVGTGAEKLISLKLRGDGIQAKFVPKILDFLSSINEEKKYFIWGFEEPENSAEYINQQILAKELKENFARNKQIFITTHSEEFLQLHDGVEIEEVDRVASLYHVKKISDTTYGEYSKIFPFDVDKGDFSELFNDLGESYLRAKHSKELKKKESDFLEEKRQFQDELTKYKKLIEQSSKPMILVEDEYEEIYKVAWLRLFNKNFSKENFKPVFDKHAPFLIFGQNGATNLAGFLRAPKIDYLSDRQMLGIFDFDSEGSSQFRNLSRTNKGGTNVWGKADGEKMEGIHKKRGDHKCCYAMLIPIPENLKKFADLEYESNYVEIENLLPLKFLETHQLTTQKRITGDIFFSEVTKNGKTKIRESLLFDISQDDFGNFRPLFKKAYDLLEIAKPLQDGIS